MIPQFPKFKKLGLEDRGAVESHTKKYPPYSDFNFTSLWAWDTNNKRMVSELNGNLVVQFTDYSTHEPFLSFLGIEKTEHTMRELIDYSKAQGLPAKLRLIPEISTKNVRPSLLHVVEDRNNFDYVYSIPKLSAMKGKTFATKRHLTNNFLRDNPDAHLGIIDLSDTAAQKDIVTVIDKWERNKIDDKKEYELEHELAAIHRLCQSSDTHNLIVTAVFAKGVILAFSIEEALPDQYCIAHFWKADARYRGVYDFFINHKARHFETLDIAFLNYEQDLGIPSLRHSKNSLRPAHFLKKYKVSINTG